MDSEVSRQLTSDQQAIYRDLIARHRHQRERAKSASGGRPQ